MSSNKENEMKNKAVGTVEEVAGKIMGNPQLEVKGKVKQGVGKMHEFADDYIHEAEDLKDTVVGTVKEKAGQLTDNHSLELRGKFQKDHVGIGLPQKLMFSLGVLAIIVLVIGLFREDE